MHNPNTQAWASACRSMHHIPVNLPQDKMQAQECSYQFWGLSTTKRETIHFSCVQVGQASQQHGRERFSSTARSRLRVGWVLFFLKWFILMFPYTTGKSVHRTISAFLWTHWGSWKIFFELLLFVVCYWHNTSDMGSQAPGCTGLCT